MDAAVKSPRVAADAAAAIASQQCAKADRHGRDSSSVLRDAGRCARVSLPPQRTLLAPFAAKHLSAVQIVAP